MTAIEPHVLLSVEGVSVRLSGRDILRDVNLDLTAGQFTGLIGPNGAGKTTLLRVILGLITPSVGRVLIEGSPRSRGGGVIGYVPQRVTLDPDMPLRGRDLVALGVDGQRFGFPLPSKSRRRRVDEVLDAVDAGGFANSRVGLLSGGEQQRVLIAHALVSVPKLLLLDEPLANLDISSERQVVDVLGRIAQEKNIGILISTHDMNPLLEVMDRVAYIAGGRVASGPTNKVVTTEALSRLYGHHVDVIRVHDRVIVVAGREDTALDHAGEEPVASVI